MSRLTRREFIQFSGLGLSAAVLAACGGSEAPRPSDELMRAFVDTLGITPTTTRQDIERMAYDTGGDPVWNTSTILGEFINKRGETVVLATDARGEPDWNVVATKYNPVEYPRPTVQKSKQLSITRNVGGVSQQLRIVVYGTLGTVSRITKIDTGIVESFLTEYFAQSKAPVNVLHLNFNPPDIETDFLVDGDNEIKEGLQSVNSDGTIYSARQGTSRFRYDDGKVEVLRVDTVLHFNVIHDNAERLGVTLQQIIPGIKANEAIGFLANNYKVEGYPPDFKINQAYSTIAGWAAAFDPGVAQLIIGGKSYEGMLPILTNEMETLADLGMK